MNALFLIQRLPLIHDQSRLDKRNGEVEHKDAILAVDRPSRINRLTPRNWGLCDLSQSLRAKTVTKSNETKPSSNLWKKTNHSSTISSFGIACLWSSLISVSLRARSVLCLFGWAPALLSRISFLSRLSFNPLATHRNEDEEVQEGFPFAKKRIPEFG